MAKSKSRKNVHPLLAAAVALALPATVAVAQGQINAGRVNDANNQVGSGGRNGSTMATHNRSLYNYNNGNQVITGNVTMGREFRGNVGYTDPYAFRGQTAGSVSDNFAKNSAGVPRAGAGSVVPNTAVPFYGVSQTVAPPPGFQLNATRSGYVPPPSTSGFRPPQDQRLGVVDLNQPITPGPTPGNIMMRGNLNPQQAAQEAGVLTGSPLYGVREWNPQDPADRAFLQDILTRQNGAFGPGQNARDITRMRDELERAILPDRVEDQQQQQPGRTQEPGGAVRPQDGLTLDPIGRTFDSPGGAAVNNRPLSDQVQARPLTAQGANTEQGIRFNLLGRARRTSEQYAELNKRLDQYYSERRRTDADFAREFNAEVAKRRKEESKSADAARNPNPGVVPTGPNAPGAPGTPGGPADPARAARPQPVKVTSLASGVRGEGLANVLKTAESLMKEGKFTSAMDQYDAAEAVTPNNPLIWLGRGHAELGAGFYMRAEAHLRQALTTDRALLMGQYDLNAMLGEERVARLASELKEQANKDATRATPLFLLAYLAYNTGHEQQALGYLDLAEQRGGDQGGFFKLLKDHWALPDAGRPRPQPAPAAEPTPAPATPAEAPKPELNK